MRAKGLGFRWMTAFGAVVVVNACGGGASPTPPAPPRQASAPAERGQGVEPGPMIHPEAPATEVPQAAARPYVFGVDLDTVRAGRFDQGKMWTFEAPPVDYLEATYGFRPDAAWFEKARLGALRIPSCSASFVSSDGLVMTNHHCAREFVSQVSAEGETLLDSGFIATDLADERAVEDFEADQLVEIVDVTAEVNARVDAAAPEQRADERETVLKEIEERLTAGRGGEDSGFVVEMVSLYNGGLTSAYVFQRYTNAKLVMAPEVQIGFFGGDPDNFTFPRYNLDFSFFRIYGDDGNPLKNDTWFSVSEDGIQDGDAVFIVGNPGSTSRLQTVAELEYRRDVSDRDLLAALRSRMGILDAYIRANPEEAEERDLRNQYFGLSNSEKAYEGQVRGLEDPLIIARRKDTERQFQAAIQADPTLAARYGDLIEQMATLQTRKREISDVSRAFSIFGNPYLDASTLIRGFWGLQVIAMTQNGAPPDEIEGMLDNVRETPQMAPDLDVAIMAARFQDLQRSLGDGHPAVAGLLRGRTPWETAQSIHAASALSDSAGAVAAFENGTASPQDAAVQAIVAILPAFLELNNLFVEVGPLEEEISADLGRARFEIYGTDVPPDATFSLRIADGVVSGYEYNGTVAPAFTTMYGLYDRHFSNPGKEDWALPERWKNPPASLDLSTPLDFVSTVDIIGGNSGSPVLDKDLRVVGVVFDGNIESLPGDYIYLPESNRSVTVDIRAILEALGEVYDMDRLVRELLTGRVVATEAEADRSRD